MSKAAAKEPSMDEILSSIRQIIADDDEGDVTPAAEVAPEPDPVEELMADAAKDADAAPEVAEEPVAEEPAPEVAEEPAEEVDAALSLSADQIVEEEANAEADLDAEVESLLADEDDEDISDLVEPDDISFDAEPEEAMEMAPVVEPEPIPAPEPEPAPMAAMPDPTLSEDMAEQLLAPATDAAVKSTFSKLSNVALGAHNLTIENMIREMLRPMLKDWLDENLPVVVEKMVEKEIERISRGG